MKFEVEVELSLPEVRRVFIIEAESKEEALRIAKEEDSEADDEVSEAVLDKRDIVDAAQECCWQDAKVKAL